MIHEACPCDSGRPYPLCCGPLHHGARKAATAQALMRSRYSAYQRGELEYLVSTLHPDRREERLLEKLADSNLGVRWTGLMVLDTVKGGTSDDTGIVEFVAHYEGPQGPAALRERSRFTRVNGDWMYVEAEKPRAAAGIGRNDPCPCGSGKKFKKCCGR